MASSTPTEYIRHHLTNLVYGQIDGQWKIAESAAESAQMGFWKFHIDSLGWSAFLGIIFCFTFWKVAKTATTRSCQTMAKSTAGRIP